MDQLGVVTAVLVIAALLTSMEELRKAMRRRAAKSAATASESGSEARPQKVPAEAADASLRLSSGVEEPGDLVESIVSDLESDDERRVSRAMTLVERAPEEPLASRLIQMLRHPRPTVSGRAATALLRLGTPASVEPLYLYYTARSTEAASS